MKCITKVRKFFLFAALLISPLAGLSGRTVQLTAADSAALMGTLAQAEAGDTLILDGGVYAGPLTIGKSIAVIGRNQAVIDGANRGTVVTVTAPGVILRGLTIRNSGSSLNDEDAGITVLAPRALIEDNRIERVLFGVYIKKADSCVVSNNFIEGKAELAIPRRGDLVRAWYSQAVQIKGNTLRHGRDMIIWFSKGSVVSDNNVTHARYGVHFMYSDDCRISDNILTGNSVGAYMMYSRRLIIERNTIAYNRGPSGFGIGLKDFDDGLLRENLIVDNRVGIFVDNSPRSVESSMDYQHNLIAYNDIGISLLSFVSRSHLSENSFIENYEQVGVNGGGDLIGNQWTDNYWSDYVGYDADGDGTGDLPYKSQEVFENLMDRHPRLRWFLYSPAVQAIEFAGRAFPQVKPKPKLNDQRPRMNPMIPAGLKTVELPRQWPLTVTALSLIGAGLLAVVSIGYRRKGRLPRNAPRRDFQQPIENKTGKPMMIDVASLVKRFGKLTAVDGLTFQVRNGEAVALWGSNGAGKTTVLRCLLGVLPYQGQIHIGGQEIQEHSKAARRMIGFVPQEISFHDNLSIRETLEFYALLKKTTLEGIGGWVEKLGLQAHLSKTVKELSGGMKQRLALAIALLADPPLLLLDEPTSNLDMKSRDDFLDLLVKLKKAGKTIVFSSHRLEEVFSFADRVLILDQGKLLADAAPREVYQKLGKHSLLRIYLPAEQISSALDILKDRGFSATRNGSGIKVQVEAQAKAHPLTILARRGVFVENFEYEIEH